MKYNHKKIEQRWQREWAKKKIYITRDKGKKKYVLAEFPYPSGEGLHMGHLRPYVAGDVTSRFLRMKGYEVMYPMGWDAFGLPAENYAIKNHVNPRVSTSKNIKNAKKQLINWGMSFDWSREINTTDPGYYKWTQWIFLQLFRAGLAYEATGLINWCPKDKTGLANEEVIDGKCDRCGTVVEKKEMKQWYLKITAYAEKLLAGLKNLDWPERVKVQQENWIGKSEGASIKFQILNSKFNIEVFTTRPDTIFGATYLVVAPELISKFKNQNAKLQLKIQNWAEVDNYVQKAKTKTDIQRTADEKDKTGVELKGVKAINPATKEEIPIWIADYVLSGYGTGAIMAVPAHDERDWEFAKKYGLKIVSVVEPLSVQEIGEDKVHSGEKFVERNAVAVVVKHWKDDKYIGLKWKLNDWQGLVCGGIEEGEDAVAAAKREVEEETGYTNMRFVRLTPALVHAKFYHSPKMENRFAHMRGVYLELSDESHRDISEEEKALQTMKWLTRTEMEKFLNRDDMVWVWKQLIDGEVAYSGDGILANSQKFDGMDSEKAKGEIIKFVNGVKKTQYKLRDWVFSRQRYWGEPIPIVHCEECGIVPVPEKDLPVKLPPVKNYEPTGTGESPLAAVESWVNVKCPKCKGLARRETNTMPQWAGSSWYYLRYADPGNKKELAKKKLLEHWLPVDIYFGGMEHTTLHLLYSRFWHLFLYDQKIVPTLEPFAKRVPHGIILAEDGEKMSKSRGNVVNPDAVVKEFGADALRMYELFLGPHEDTVSWNSRGIIGVERFLEKVWNIVNSKVKAQKSKSQVKGQNVIIEKLLHKTIKKVTEDIENIKFNTAVSALMIFVNQFSTGSNNIEKQNLEIFLRLLAPFAPHLSEELWHELGRKSSIHLEKWPEYDPELVKEMSVNLPVQINGKVRSTIQIPVSISEDEIKEIVQKDPVLEKYLVGKAVKKVIYVKGKIINFVVA